MRQIYSPFLESGIELCGADGTVQKTLHYKIDIEKSYKAITARRAAFTAQAQVAINTGSEEAQRLLGEIFIDMLTDIFGKENTDELLDWYDDGVRLIGIIMPILVEDIFPGMERQRQQYMAMKEVANRYAIKQDAQDGD